VRRAGEGATHVVPDVQGFEGVQHRAERFEK
jgi:hypothetical protein